MAIEVFLHSSAAKDRPRPPMFVTPVCVLADDNVTYIPGYGMQLGISISRNTHINAGDDGLPAAPNPSYPFEYG